MKKYLGIDVGGTAIKYALLNEEAEILEKGEVPTPKESLEVYLDTLQSIYERYAGDIEAIVMSAPGKIDAKTGYCYTSGALKYADETDMKALMAERCPVPFSIENDAKAAALAELWKGSMKGMENGTVITLGTAIGGALIINGKLYRGSTFAAGEYSNIGMQFNDALAPHSGWYHAGSVGELCKKYALEIGADPDQMTGRILFGDANEGNETARRLIQEYAYGIVSGIYSLQVILDMQRVAIGGGISKQPLLMEAMQAELDRIFAEKTNTPMTKPEIVSCTFGNDANMIGALYHYLYE